MTKTVLGEMFFTMVMAIIVLIVLHAIHIPLNPGGFIGFALYTSYYSFRDGQRSRP